MRQCTSCNEYKELTEYAKSGTYKGVVQYRGGCKQCFNTERLANPKVKEQQKIYRSSDEYKEKRKAYRQLSHVQEKERAYEKSIAPKRSEHRRKRENNNYKNDPIFKLKKVLGQRTREMFKIKKWQKKNSFKEHVGCTLEQAKLHIEKQFQPGMNWQNHGEWEIDHIIPLSSAKTPEELYKLCHYTNLQPLWWKLNMIKSDKMPGEY